jgi:hypothetical protein
MGESKENLLPENHSRATARADSAEIPLSWAPRGIDIAAMRRWFIHRVALEAMKELNQEREHEPRNG